jgi:serine/threonine-protein kinase HipA
MSESGVWRFSPAYDITFSNGPGGEHSTMYLGEGKNPTSKHLLKLAKRYSIKDAVTIIEEVKDAVLDWSKFADIADVKPKLSKQIQKEFKL